MKPPVCPMCDSKTAEVVGPVAVVPAHDKGHCTGTAVVWKPCPGSGSKFEVGWVRKDK